MRAAGAFVAGTGCFPVRSSLDIPVRTKTNLSTSTDATAIPPTMAMMGARLFNPPFTFDQMDESKSDDLADSGAAFFPGRVFASENDQ